MAAESAVFCSLVIPCFNEAENLAPLAEGFAAALGGPAGPGDFELIIVDNGSSDGSAVVLSGLERRFAFLRAVTVPENRGYGHGISRGLEAARGLYAGWAHGDLQYSPAEIMRAVGLLRAAPGEKIFLKGLRSSRPPVETAFTAGMALFESLLFAAPLWDINAQPTLFHRSLLMDWAAAPPDFSLDLYAYALARKRGFAVRRVPMTLGKRARGVSSWNRGLLDRFRVAARTVKSSFLARKAISGAGKKEV